MSSFADEAKARQAEFRAHSPTVNPQGHSPSDPYSQRHGHLLAPGQEQKNLYPSLRGENGALKFFRDREIQWHRHSRSGDAKKKDGPTRNMVSSQIACVNFLLPLCEIPSALAAVARAIDDDVNDIVCLSHDGRVSPIEFEWIGLCSPLEEDVKRPTRGANVTSIDAFMVAATANGRRAYLMEWKYTENYPVGRDKGEGRSGETRRSRYAPLYADSPSFNGTVPMEEFLYEPFYQIMRLRLLADRMVKRKEFGVSDAKVVVVVPQENAAYRERITSEPLRQRFPKAKTVEDVVFASLNRSNKAFAMVSPSILVDAVEQECGNASSDWTAYQRRRYGW
ncbi:MAG: hypothetical protein OXI72_09090 [Gemmatimonadota bacterium]|nr:hypothetical protein [Gemmatimonadota bacterium]